MKPSVLARIASQLSRPSAIVDAVEATQESRNITMAEYVAPADEFEAGVADIWGRLLRVKRVGRADDFFLMGGQSLIATQMVSRVWERFGVEISLDLIFTNTTVEAFAATVRKAAASGRTKVPLPLTGVVRPAQIPLSFAQQRLWIAHHVSSARALFNHPLALRIRGQLDVAALRFAIAGMIARHEALRTCFTEMDGSVEQTIRPPHRIEMDVVLLVTNSGESWEAAFERAACDEAAKPFDLANEIPFRTLLLRADATDHQLVIVAHHIATDGWSDHIMLGELCQLYQAKATGQAVALPPLPFQYADYAVWQRQVLAGERLQMLESYWRRQLAGAPDQIALPTDRERPTEPTFSGAQVPLRLPGPLTKRLEDICKRHRCSVFMLLCTAFMVLMSRWSGQDDLIVGTDLANRKSSELERLIGFFVNVLPLRAKISGGPTFLELLQQTRETALGAYAHQEMPFDKIVEDLSPGRTPGRNPLVQVIFVMQNTPQADLKVIGIAIEQVPLPVRHSRFDLGVFAREVDDGVALDWHYSTEIFDVTTISTMANEFRQVLDSVAEFAEIPVSRLLPKRQPNRDFDIPDSPLDREAQGQRLRIARRRTTKV